MSISPVVLDAAAVEDLLPQIDVMSEVRQLFVALGQHRAVQPPQTITLLPEDKGDFITYLGAMDVYFGAKLSPYLVQEKGGLVTAWTLLMSAQTGHPLMLCDAAQLTVERTAATTALAVDLLAQPAAKHLAIIGSGPIAQAHWRYVQTLRPWDRVRIYSPNLQDNPTRQSQWRNLCPDVEMVQGPALACDGADAILLCTSSGTPVVDLKSDMAGTLVTSISTNVPGAHEVPPAVLPTAQVYCDDKHGTPAAAAEMCLAQSQHGWSADQIVGDLADLATCRADLPTGDKAVYFRSIGLGLEDIAIARAIYDAARAAKEGMSHAY
ncbi:ornithine cyclodeaminase family protein [Phaeobacter sp.]|uniref:ornithine cyclodeaminase family protein n=1 Tax=Phaeobacter sp. TaxID=1902409 RepID=UPI0025F12C55|nr:ornithine cyclodeaminase family protein [Phaeobacter sp.]